MLPSPPALAIDMAHAAFANVVSMVTGDINEIILFRTELTSTVNDIASTIVMLPYENTLGRILELLDKLVDLKE